MDFDGDALTREKRAAIVAKVKVVGVSGEGPPLRHRAARGYILIRPPGCLAPSLRARRHTAGVTAVPQASAELAAHFADAEAYNRRICKFVPYYEEIMDSLLACLPQAAQELPILELGCGTGNFTLRILESGHCTRLTALDVVPAMVQSCTEQLGARAASVELLHADFTEFSRPAAFDCVLSNLALHYPETDEKKIRACRHVFQSLRPGGRFAFSVMLEGETPERTQQLWRAWEKDLFRKGVPRTDIQQWYAVYHASDFPVSPRRWLEWLAQAGFTECELVWRRTVFGTIWTQKP